MAFGFIAAAHYDSALSDTAVVAKPTGTSDNDIMFSFVKRTSATDPTTVPTGWTQIAKDDGATTDYWLYWKLAASEGADYTWIWAATTRLGATIVTYRDGFNTANPIDVVSNTSYVVSDTNVRAASMTVAAVNSPLIFFGATHKSTTQSFTPPTVPATFVEDLDTWSSASRMAREIASVVWTGSGATGAMDAIADAITTDKHAFAVALNPAAGGLSIPVAMHQYARSRN